MPYIIIPVGISFFTFQAMSYVIDVYTGKARVQNKFVPFALYVSLFPQLIAGPIVKYSDVNMQIRKRQESAELFCSGVKRFCYGLGKKVLISNTFAEIADAVWGLETASIGTVLAWFGAIAHTLQIYYDFSGYSDMAIGLGRMLGFQFKEYVYIPLGGNRKGQPALI